MARTPDTTARLRDEIDRGRGGDKMNFSDPAAAPLGTDDEAAGTPAPPEAVARARAQEVSRRPDDASAGRGSRHVGALNSRRNLIFWAGLGLVILILCLIAVLGA